MISWKRKSPPYDKLSSVLSHTRISSKSHPHAICPCSLLKYGTSVLQSEIQQSLDMAGLPIRFPFQRFFFLRFHDQLVKKKPISIAFCFSFNTYLKLLLYYCAHLLQTEMAVHQKQVNWILLLHWRKNSRPFMISHPILMIWFSMVFGNFEKLVSQGDWHWI